MTSMMVPSVMETLESAQKSSIVPDQEFLLQGSVVDSAVHVLMDRLRGLCDCSDTIPEDFHDHEVVFILKDFSAPTQGPQTQGVMLRVRRALNKPNLPWQLRYTGQPEIGNRPAILRNCLDIPVSQNICEFLQELGAKVDHEFITKGYILRKGRVKVTVFKMYKIGSGGPGLPKENLEPLTISHLVEASVLTTRTDEGVADELRAFADQLKPLVQLEKLDYRRPIFCVRASRIFALETEKIENWRSYINIMLRKFSKKEALREESDASAIAGVLDLPNEILLKIFSYLNTDTIASRARLVCKRWCEVSGDASLWRAISFRGNKSVCQIPKVISKYPLLRSLKIEKGLLNSSIFSSAASLQFLNSLSLLECTFFLGSKSSFEALVKRPSLSTLRMEKCFMDTQIYEIISEAVNLKDLTITEIESLYLIKLAANCELQKLRIYKTNHLAEGAVRQVFVSNSETLREIELDGEKRFTDSAFAQVEECLNISNFSLARCDDITDNVLKKLGSLPLLNHLCLKYGSSFTSTGLRELFLGSNAINLLHLDFSRCSDFDDECLFLVSENCKQLQHLYLKYCIKLTDLSVFRVVENCRSLVKLDLSCILKLKGVFLAIVREHKHLRVVDLRGCTGIEKNAIQTLQFSKPSIQVYK